MVIALRGRMWGRALPFSVCSAFVKAAVILRLHALGRNRSVRAYDTLKEDPRITGCAEVNGNHPRGQEQVAGKGHLADLLSVRFE
jgi:hypothetical protein